MNLQEVKKNFENRGFHFSLFADERQAAAYLCREIQDQRVSMGGSKTLEELGLYKELKKNNAVFWHWREKGRYELSPDVYLTSANGLSGAGEIVNIDGNGNRVAGAAFGAKSVFVICGINKLRPDLAGALDRARNVAAPRNAQRLGMHTPCAEKADHCYDCNAPECICRVFSIMRKPVTSVLRYEVVLIQKNLGF